MHTVKGTVKNGQIALAEPVTWPEGTEVRVRPVQSQVGEDSFQMEGGDQPDDPESIAQWIAEFDAISPMQMTDAEEAEWMAARSAQRDLDRAS